MNPPDQAPPPPCSSPKARTITLQLDEASMTYFQALSVEEAVPVPHLIEMLLRECALSGQRPSRQTMATFRLAALGGAQVDAQPIPRR